MMKKTILWGLWPMLFFLVIFATPEKCNANPMEFTADPLMIARPIRNGIPNPMESSADPPTMTRSIRKRNAKSESCSKNEPKVTCLVENISGGMKDILKEIDTPKNYKNNIYKDTIGKLEKKLHKLPNYGDDVFKQLGKGKVLFSLYEASDSIISTKTVLTVTATNLKKHCQELIDVFEDNPEDLSNDIIKYTAGEFDSYAKMTKNRLEVALDEYKQVQSNMNKAKSEMQVFSSKLKEVKTKLGKEGKRKKRSLVHHDRDKRLIGVIGLIVSIAGLAVTLIPAAINWFGSKDYTETIKLIEETEAVLQKLEDQNKEIQNFIKRELELITEWEQDLDTAINKKYHELSRIQIKYGKKGMKNSLIDLRTACEEYISHTLPQILDPNRFYTKRNIPYLNHALPDILDPNGSYTKRSTPYLYHTHSDILDSDQSYTQLNISSILQPNGRLYIKRNLPPKTQPDDKMKRFIPQ